MTIHRVLNELVEDELVTKVHGGVRASLPQEKIETRFTIRMEINKASKIEIARKARNFVRQGDTVKGVSVKIGLRTDGWSEIISESIHSGDEIVTEGQDMLDDGDTVSVRERSN